ncbi:MAG: 5-(carboxyamino)imidazole ribonucleotide synthase [Pirellulales bacterium]|jgi:5-(carboxyamino)imidazole ribonucleotide synthase
MKPDQPQSPAGTRAGVSPLLPGAMLGVLGGGQLGAMFAMAARQMGYRVTVISDTADVPAQRHADRFEQIAYTDIPRLSQVASEIDAVTFEFENVPAEAGRAMAAVTRVHPSPDLLSTTQDRGREKAFLTQHGFATTPHRLVTSAAQLHQAVADLGLPGVVKTASFGYDGRGQIKLTDASHVAAAWETLRSDRLVFEAWVDYSFEMSVVVARAADASVAAFAPSLNQHTDHILDVASSPAPLAPGLAEEAKQVACRLAAELGLVGVACIEFFVTRDGRLLVNEIAPRPHNSGHLTIESAATSQFEQQVRAVCGLPLGSTATLAPAAMANLLGDLWRDGEPDWEAALSVPGVRLHLYGKTSARPGRKMGHITACAPTVREAIVAATEARRRAAPGLFAATAE